MMEKFWLEGTLGTDLLLKAGLTLRFCQAPQDLK